MHFFRVIALVVSLLLVALIAVPQTSVMTMKPTGLQFPDGSMQTSAGATLNHNHVGQQWTGSDGLSIVATGSANVAGLRGRAGTNDFNSAGVYGDSYLSNSAAAGVFGFTRSNNGLSTAVLALVGDDANYNGSADAVYASAFGFGNAIWGVAEEATATAGRFSGNVVVTGTLSKGAGSFRIDHPLDPLNKYLYHSFVESPDMKNIYDGVVMLDDIGEAVVELPEWFEALNRDFRYQLTSIGAAAPGLHVAETIRENRFRIAGGPPRGEVSWQVTGIRKDAFANANRIPVEELKPESERGRYLHPREFGQLDPAVKAAMAPVNSKGLPQRRPKVR